MNIPTRIENGRVNNLIKLEIYQIVSILILLLDISHYYLTKATILITDSLGNSRTGTASIVIETLIIWLMKSDIQCYLSWIIEFWGILKINQTYTQVEF